MGRCIQLGLPLSFISNLLQKLVATRFFIEGVVNIIKCNNDLYPGLPKETLTG